MPVRNAATRAGEASFAAASGGAVPSVFAIAASCFLYKLQRPGIDLAAGSSRQFDRMRDAVLDAVARQRGPQEVVEVVLGHDIGVIAGRADHQHELAARFERSGSPCQFRYRRTLDV